MHTLDTPTSLFKHLKTAPCFASLSSEEYTRLKEIGWKQQLEQQLTTTEAKTSLPIRISCLHRASVEFFVVANDSIYECKITLHHLFPKRSQAPALTVGDWLLVQFTPEHCKITAQRCLNRYSTLKRFHEELHSEQILGANLDQVFIVSSLTPELNLARLERYLLTVHAAKLRPTLLLTKRDLCQSSELSATVYQRFAGRLDLTIVALNTQDREEVCQKLLPLLPRFSTWALIGSSGVGKSSIANALQDPQNLKEQATDTVRERDSKGRHTTTRRQLLWTKGRQSLLMDSPGIRGLAPLFTEAQLQESFDDIHSLALQCRFSNCTHTKEPNCAIQIALKNNSLSQERFTSFQKLHNLQKPTYLKKSSRPSPKKH